LHSTSCLKSQVKILFGWNFNDANLFRIKYHISNVKSLFSLKGCQTNGEYEKNKNLCYSEWKTKTNIQDFDKNDTTSFNMINTFIYNQTMTGELTGDEMVTLPNMVVMASTGQSLFTPGSCFPLVPLLHSYQESPCHKTSYILLWTLPLDLHFNP